MKKRNKYIVSVIVLIVIVSLGVMYMSTKTTTFKKVVLERINSSDISSIEIIKSSDATTENNKTLTDPYEIEKIMNAFSPVKLRESNVSNISFTESYWITVKTNENRIFGITLYDKNYVIIFEYDTPSRINTTKSYKITNDFNPRVIEELFI